MEVSLMTPWPMEWFLPDDEERVAVLLGRRKRPKRGEVPWRTYYASDLPGKPYTVYEVFCVNNAHNDPRNHYGIDIRGWGSAGAQAVDIDSEIIGVAHTHRPHHSRTPTDDDRAGLTTGLIGAVVLPWPGGGVKWFLGTHGREASQ